MKQLLSKGVQLSKEQIGCRKTSLFLCYTVHLTPNGSLKNHMAGSLSICCPFIATVDAVVFVVSSSPL